MQTLVMSATSVDPAASLAARDRIRRAVALRMSPAERLAAMRRLLDQSRVILERHPDGLAHFRRHNFAARAVGRNERR
jgi:hypothetical protein